MNSNGRDTIGKFCCRIIQVEFAFAMRGAVAFHLIWAANESMKTESHCANQIVSVQFKFFMDTMDIWHAPEIIFSRKFHRRIINIHF